MLYLLRISSYIIGSTVSKLQWSMRCINDPFFGENMRIVSSFQPDTIILALDGKHSDLHTILGKETLRIGVSF